VDNHGAPNTPFSARHNSHVNDLHAAQIGGDARLI
jgi:hypothetical protein